MICSTETRTSKIIHLTHTLKQTIINYTPDPTITSTFPAFIITLLCIGNICVNGYRAADVASSRWLKRYTRCVWCELKPSFVLFLTISTVTKCRSGEETIVHPSFRIENWTAAVACLLVTGRWQPHIFKQNRKFLGHHRFLIKTNR